MPITAQMNFRIDEDLKRRGDAALAAAGYTGSGAVRALWAFAAKHEHDPEKVAHALRFDQDARFDDAAARRQRMHEAASRGAGICDAGRRKLGIGTPVDGYHELDIEELRELALEDRAQERGWA